MMPGYLALSGSVPPMEFEKLLTMFSEPDDVLTQDLSAAIQVLLARKAETEADF